ncbi:LacI family DNA-binding transcriptional regulator [uncultured Deinococcus sp.]|uniref:LacI family DNA-binding transcriptional regulator n=1 Tax=uncultured Deinococcus sp. TaxID=158789 RepID=UPI00338E82ED
MGNRFLKGALIRKKATTIYDIARQAQVSVSTVSRVLNGNSAVNAELRTRVEAAMHDLRFRPNRIAQTLFHHRSHTLGCVLPDIVSPFFAQLFLELEVGAFERGYTIILGNTVSTPALERTYLQTLAERQVDGLLYLGGLTNALAVAPEDLALLRDLAERLPIVTVNGDLPEVGIVTSVRSDEAGGMRALLSHLRAQGHTDIAFLGGQPDVTSTAEKLQVYRDLCPDHPPEWVQPTGLDIDAGIRALCNLMGAARRPSAVACINDLVAAGVLTAARARGLNLPGDLSVTGFDDVFPARITAPPLTTVNHNYAELARQALDALLLGIEGQPAPRTVTVPTLLVGRDSVAPRPG